MLGSWRRRNALKKGISDGQSDEDRAFLHDLHVKRLERDREREAQAKIRQLAEKRKHPPDPRARTIAAALFSDPWLADAIELRLRDDILLTEDGRERHIPHGEFVKVRVIEPEDLAVLFAVGLAIEQGGLFRAADPDRGLSISDVPASLARLRRNQVIEASRDGNAWRVSWGRRSLGIARNAGVPIATE